MFEVLVFLYLGFFFMIWCWIMIMVVMNCDEVYVLMFEYMLLELFQCYMFNVEMVMCWYVWYWGEDEEIYVVMGLLYDFDYELYLEEYFIWGVIYLCECIDVLFEIFDVIMGYVVYIGMLCIICFVQMFFVVDELIGLIQVVVLICFDKDVRGVELSSLKKCFKNKGFVVGVNCDEVW